MNNLDIVLKEKHDQNEEHFRWHLSNGFALKDKKYRSPDGYYSKQKVNEYEAKFWNIRRRCPGIQLSFDELCSRLKRDDELAWFIARANLFKNVMRQTPHEQLFKKLMLIDFPQIKKSEKIVYNGELLVKRMRKRKSVFVSENGVICDSPLDTTVERCDFELPFNNGARVFINHKYANDSGGTQKSRNLGVQTWFDKCVEYLKNHPSDTRTLFISVADGAHFVRNPIVVPENIKQIKKGTTEQAIHIIHEWPNIIT